MQNKKLTEVTEHENENDLNDSKNPLTTIEGEPEENPLLEETQYKL